MNSVRNKLIAGTLSLMYILSACSTPTPIVVVVTATPLPPTEAPVVETPTEAVPVQVAVAGPQSGDRIKWIDGSNLVYVPPSEFVMGDDTFKPIHNVTVDGFWMQQTPVTNRMYAQCVSVGSCLAPSQEVGGPVYSNPVYANHPVVGVTWDQGNAYCAWALGRLPTEAE